VGVEKLPDVRERRKKKTVEGGKKNPLNVKRGEIKNRKPQQK